MTQPLRLAISADLHWGHGAGREPTLQLASFLRDLPPDVLILAGDIGTGPSFGDCLGLFDDLSCRKALVPGNHDLWVGEDEPYDSLQLYREHLPRVSAEHGFHYLDEGPLILPGADLAVVGSINWYDYSWSIDALRENYPDELDRLQTKRFTRGRHNDVNFVRWPLDDAGFTREVVAALERHLAAALARVGRVVIVTHHPTYYGLSFPWSEPPTSLDGLLWDAFGGNRSLETVLCRYADRIPFAFCGHTHRAREYTWQGIRGYNVGADYPVKRLLCLEWPAGTVVAHQFGEYTYV